MTVRALAFALAAVAITASAAADGDQIVTLPYTQPDKDGNQWMVHFYGYLQQQGNMPVYSNAGVLTVNGASHAGRIQRSAKLDGRTGELVLENLMVGGVTVTRRFQFNKDEGYVRMIDIFKNTQARDQQVAVTLNSNSNYGLQGGQTVADAKKKTINAGFIGQTQANGKVIVELYNGSGAKSPLNIDFQQGNNQATGSVSLSIPANKEIAVMHVHAVANSTNEAQDFIRKFKEAKALKDVAPGLRKMIVNFSAGTALFNDVTILRGDVTDVVEMRTGDQFRGTLKDPTYKIATFYGPVEVKADNVVSMVSAGAVRARQLLFTTDGDVIGGALEKDKVAIELSDGQVMQIPLTQISRVGYRKRAGEDEEPIRDKPVFIMRTGERISVKMPADPITVHTRYGTMKIKPESISAIIFQNEDHAVHAVQLTDGTRLAALVEGGMFQATLASSDQVIKFPLSSAARIQFRPDGPDVDDQAPQLKLGNDETMVGTLTGKLKLDTGFSMLSLDAEGIKSLTRVKDAPLDVQVSLWDQTSFRGQLQEPEVTCLTKGGLEVKIPIALVEDYVQPLPKPSGTMITKIRELAGELNADDWGARQKAQEKLINLGSAAGAVLKEMRATQPEEAQSRIDQILTAIEKKGK